MVTDMKSLLAVLALVLVAGCGGGDEPAAKPSPTPATSKAPAALTAVVLVSGLDTLGIVDGTPACETREGRFESVHTGAQVTLKDSSGNQVDSAVLGDPDTAPPENVCAWQAEFKSVPAGKGPYVAQVGGYSSEPVTEDQLTNEGEPLTISIE